LYREFITNIKRLYLYLNFLAFDAAPAFFAFFALSLSFGSSVFKINKLKMMDCFFTVKILTSYFSLWSGRGHFEKGIESNLSACVS